VPQQGTLTNIDGLKWNKGKLFGTRSGGNTDAIQFGALQSVELNHTIEWADIRGPESLSILGRGQVSETLTGTFECGVITPEQYFMALGGNLTYDAGADETTYTKLVNEEAGLFNVHCVSEDGNSPGMDVTVYRCTADNWRIYGGANRAWMLGGGGFTAHGEANSGRLFTVTMPGSLINAS
jgi:hypothetical protein